MWKVKPYREQEFIWLLKGLVALYDPEIYLECGIRKAWTFNQMIAIPKIKRAIGIDIVDCSKYIKNSPIAQFIVTSTQEFAKSWNGPTIDLIFHNASHEASDILRDVRSFRNILTPYTGVLFIHDTYPVTPELATDGYCFDAWKAGKLLHRSSFYDDWEIFTFPGPWAGGSLLRYVPAKHTHWK